MLKKQEKLICIIIVIGMFFSGMCLEFTQIDSSFLCAKDMDAEGSLLEEDSLLVSGASIFTLDMMRNSTSLICRELGNSSARHHGGIVLLFSVVGAFSQYLFFYQSCECKEDGQLLLCRSVAVKYIHQKDGEK